MAKAAIIHEFTIPERVKHLELKVNLLQEQAADNQTVLNTVVENQGFIKKILKLLEQGAQQQPDLCL